MSDYQTRLLSAYYASVPQLQAENRRLKRIIAALLLAGTLQWLLSIGALAQGFDDPRVPQYAAMISGMQQTEQKILAKRERFCAAGLTDYCGPPPFVPQMSVEEFRARLAK